MIVDAVKNAVVDYHNCYNWNPDHLEINSVVGIMHLFWKVGSSLYRYQLVLVTHVAITLYIAGGFNYPLIQTPKAIKSH